MQQTYAQYIKNMQVKGAPLLRFSCPHCRSDIETVQPPHGDVWDSITDCPFCSAVFFKVVIHSGVKTLLMKTEK